MMGETDDHVWMKPSDVMRKRMRKRRCSSMTKWRALITNTTKAPAVNDGGKDANVLKDLKRKNPFSCNPSTNTMSTAIHTPDDSSEGCQNKKIRIDNDDDNDTSDRHQLLIDNNTSNRDQFLIDNDTSNTANLLIDNDNSINNDDEVDDNIRNKNRANVFDSLNSYEKGISEESATYATVIRTIAGAYNSKASTDNNLQQHKHPPHLTKHPPLPTKHLHLPVDVSLKGRLRFSIGINSEQPSINQLVSIKGNEEAIAARLHLTECYFNNNNTKNNTTNNNTNNNNTINSSNNSNTNNTANNNNSSFQELKIRFHSKLFYYQYPCIPWLTLFPRVNSNKHRQKETISLSKDAEQALYHDWCNSMASCFQNIKQSNTPYMYVCCHHMTILFLRPNLLPSIKRSKPNERNIRLNNIIDDDNDNGSDCDRERNSDGAFNVHINDNINDNINNENSVNNNNKNNNCENDGGDNDGVDNDGGDNDGGDNKDSDDDDDVILAFVTPTTKGFRKALEIEGIEFSLPLVTKKTKRRSNDSSSQPLVDHSANLDATLNNGNNNNGNNNNGNNNNNDNNGNNNNDNNGNNNNEKNKKSSICSEIGDNNGECEKSLNNDNNNKVDDDDDDDDDDEDDEDDDEWLERLGISKSIHIIEEPGKDLGMGSSSSPPGMGSSSGDFKRIDYRPESVVLVRGLCEVNAFFNFILNFSSLTSSVGHLASIPPTILSPTPFHAASLQALKIANKGEVYCGRGGANDKDVIRRAVFEVTGPVMPLTLDRMCHVLSDVTAEFGTTSFISSNTASFNCSEYYKGGSEGGDGTSGLCGGGSSGGGSGIGSVGVSSEEVILNNSLKEISYKDGYYSWKLVQ